MAAARPFDDGSTALSPIWLQEALHRAVSMLRLFTALYQRDGSRPSPRGIYERRLALHLAAELASLESAGASCVLPCSGPLREIARDLVGLFGPAIGEVVLDTEVASLTLPAYRRRALVLLGSELVTNALTHAFRGRSVGHVSLCLWRVGTDRLRLRVGDDGVGYARGRPVPGRSIAGALTDLLAGDITYIAQPGGGSMAEVLFPISA